MTKLAGINLCRFCGGRFKPPDIRFKYCSPACRREGTRRIMRAAYERYDERLGLTHFQSNCGNCGRPIKNNARYCSQKDCVRAQERPYIRKYMYDRYHSDEEFRRRVINTVLRYQQKLRKEKS